MNSSVVIDGLGEIEVIRNRKSKNAKLRINHDGRAVVSAPPLVPMFVIKRFVESKSDWILKHSSPAQLIKPGAIIGRGFEVQFIRGQKFSVRIKQGFILATLTKGQSVSDSDVQAKLNSVATECLRRQAKAWLPNVVDKWSGNGAGSYKSVTIKLIKSRWGSYTSDGSINLSLFMMQLPDALIDYVVVHELSHSLQMNHSPKFWAQVEKHLPNYKILRKELKNYQMRIIAK